MLISKSIEEILIKKRFINIQLKLYILINNLIYNPEKYNFAISKSIEILSKLVFD